MRQRGLDCLGPSGFHRISYIEWPGPETRRVTICLHGLTRNGRDFDFLAARLSQSAPVLAPDMAGRGASDWLTARQDYGYRLYVQDVATLFARSGAEQFDIVGTSMGGIVGMILAAQSGTRVRRLVLNDVGGYIPAEALQWIASYVGADKRFSDLDELEAYQREIYAGFGPLTDAQRRHLAQHGHRTLPEGGYALAYDPAIFDALAGPIEPVDLWGFYDRMRCPTLLIRGAQSELLPDEVAQEMTRRGPCARLYVVPDAGHAPGLMDDAQIETIRAFLDEA